MTRLKLNRDLLHFKKLTDRKNRIFIEKDQVPVSQKPVTINL